MKENWIAPTNTNFSIGSEMKPKEIHFICDDYFIRKNDATIEYKESLFIEDMYTLKFIIRGQTIVFKREI